MSRDPGRSLITHPDATLFLRVSREGVFQQPLPIALFDLKKGEEPAQAYENA